MSMIKFADRVKIMDWLDNHRDEAACLTPAELIPRIQADIPLAKISAMAIKEAAKVRGVLLLKRKKPVFFSPRNRQDAASVLAKSIRQIAGELGVQLEYSREIDLIVSRMNLPE